VTASKGLRVGDRVEIVDLGRPWGEVVGFTEDGLGVLVRTTEGTREYHPMRLIKAQAVKEKKS